MYCLISSALSPATKQARKRHWNCYLRSCKKYRFSPVPCSPLQACYYLSILALYMKFSSVTTYYQSVVFYHTFFFFNVPLLSDDHLNYVLAGIKKDPAKGISPVEPLTPCHLKKLYLVVDFNAEIQVNVWVAVIVPFCTLLRVSHVIDSPHTLYRLDVSFTSWGVVGSVFCQRRREKISS